MERERVLWIDCAKGIAIILVIFGHTIGSENTIESILRGVIFSFHMPLFFILSCVTFKLSENAQDFVRKAEKSFKHLIIPAICIYIGMLIYEIIQKPIVEDLHIFLRNVINRFVYASGSVVTIDSSTILALGMPWFLVVLFLGKILFDYINLKIKAKNLLIILTCLFSVLGIIISYLQWLPFSFDLVLAIMPFFLFGFYLQKVDIKERLPLRLLLSIIVFCISLFAEYYFKNTYLELACRRYPLYPLCFVTAISGTMIVSYISQLMQLCKIFTWLNFVGRNSFLVFTVHAFDLIWRSTWKITQNNIINGFIRILIDIIIVVLIIFIKIWRNKKKVNAV